VPPGEPGLCTYIMTNTEFNCFSSSGVDNFAMFLGKINIKKSALYLITCQERYAPALAFYAWFHLQKMDIVYSN